MADSGASTAHIKHSSSERGSILGTPEPPVPPTPHTPHARVTRTRTSVSHWGVEGEAEKGGREEES